MDVLPRPTLFKLTDVTELRLVTVYNELIITGGLDRKLQVIERESVTKTIKLPGRALCCLIIGHTLIIGGI